MDKVKKDLLFRKCLTDYRLGINHLRVVYYAMDVDSFNVHDVCSVYKIKRPYANRILNELLGFDYIEVKARDLVTGVYIYNFKGGE